MTTAGGSKSDRLESPVALTSFYPLFLSKPPLTPVSSSSCCQGYAALNSDFDSFYTRRLKTRLDDCFSKPVTAVPGRTILTYDRTSTDSNHTFVQTGEKTRSLNISSYNYLGFASSTGGCADAVEESIRRYGVSAAGARLDAGSLDLHVQAEKLVARFLGKDDSIVVSMGFATNSTTMPALVGKGCLVISDELNHASIRFGVRLSGASVRQFKHNDMVDLESLLREVISQGQPRTHRPWKKILVVVEGIYSMEGNMVDLPRMIELKRKYKVGLAKLSFLTTTADPLSSSTSTSTRLTRSAVLVRMAAVFATTLAFTRPTSTFLWVPLRSRSALLEATSPARANSCSVSVIGHMPWSTPRLCHPQSSRRSSPQWAPSWASPRLSLLQSRTSPLPVARIWPSAPPHTRPSVTSSPLPALPTVLPRHRFSHPGFVFPLLS